MTLTALPHGAAFAVIVVIGLTTGAVAQTTASDPHHADTQIAQATPPAAPDSAGQAQNAQPGQPGMMSPGMMGQGMMGGVPMMPMRGHMMKIMFAIVDANGDGGISFEELTAIHKRIFDKVDVNRDGKVTPDEVQAFMRE